MLKIEEVKNIPVMDVVRAPAKKDKPKRAIIVLSVFFFSLFVYIGYTIIQYQYGMKISGIVKTLQSLNKK